LLRRDQREPFNAFASRRKRVGEFRRHGHDVPGRRPDGGFDLAEGFRNALDAEAKRGGNLRGIKNATILGARRLQMNTPDIPSDHDAHGASSPWYGRLYATDFAIPSKRRRACRLSRSSI
jgi:hypothetical protein